MKYARWFIDNSRGIRLNILVRIMAGLLQTVLALCVVWLSKRLIDDIAMTGTMGEMAMQALLIAAAEGSGDRFLSHVYTIEKWHVQQERIQIAESITLY